MYCTSNNPNYFFSLSKKLFSIFCSIFIMLCWFLPYNSTNQPYFWLQYWNNFSFVLPTSSLIPSNQRGFLKYIYIGSPYHAHTQPFSGFPFYQNNIPNAFFDLLSIASLSNSSIRAQNFAPVFPSSWNVPPHSSFNCWFLLRLLTSVQILLLTETFPDHVI